eukprot:CAMPEP_0179281504 /NCGR_PEP_ID=MMETSP0797-20121207/37187_1 /TAXON_ID=47934 /ORGANISM="Dinophysis acuminata, Strain DAEP01" /LENGTH=217 /DNA_ID=CAMNT_0020990213 /DNA_START=32 /DNA_END=685 /DNA_ORIENTATION=-
MTICVCCRDPKPSTSEILVTENGLTSENGEDMSARGFMMEQRPLLGEEDAVYDVNITKKSWEKWGLDVEIIDSSEVPVLGVVHSIRPGAVQSHCQRSAAKTIEVGDGITEVNGESCNIRKVLGDLVNTGSLSMKLRRPVELRVAVRREGRPLGLDLINRQSGYGLLVHQLSEGAFYGSEVQPGDFVLEVNGVSGGSDKLLEMIDSAEDLDLKIVRYE